MRSIPIFDTNIFGHAQSGLISPSEWRLLNRYRPGRGWRLSSVSALELLVDLDNATSEEQFKEFQERLELAVKLSNGRVLEEPRLLICKDVLNVSFPARIPRFPVEALSAHMQGIRRAESLKHLREGLIRWKSRYAKLESLDAVRNVVALVKQQWKRQVHQFADAVFPEWRTCYAETGRRLPAEMRKSIDRKAVFEARSVEFARGLLEVLEVNRQPRLVSDMRARLDAVLSYQSGGSTPSTGTVTPTITSIVPDWGKVGTNKTVTISGSGFGTAPTVTFTGTGITVSYGTPRNDTTVVAIFTIASNAPIGMQGVKVSNTTVTGGSITSDPFNFQVTPASAVPVNFHLASASDQGAGALPLLEADFAWESSTGNYLDLSACFLRENVTFPNTNNGTCPSPGTQNCFYPSSPPWAAKGSAGSGYPNPTITSLGVPAGGLQNSDYDKVGNLNFVKPYSYSPFSGQQLFQYSCNGGSWNTIYGPVSINYSMSKNASNEWQIVVSRSDTPKTSVFVKPNQ